MPNELIDFWQCELNSPPFAHPKDLDVLRSNPRWIANDDPTDFASYIKSKRFEDATDDRLHLSLLPVPYVGNIRNAEIVILLLNPGFQYSDYWSETNNPEFRKRLKQNLQQSFDAVEFPFLFLDPQFCWPSGFMWWEKKLRDVLKEIALRKFSGNYHAALHDLSQRLACVELIPYHSRTFKDHKLISLLPSIQTAKRFVQTSLVQDAVSMKRTLIATRQVKEWGITKSHPNVVTYDGGHARGASLGVKSKGGNAILKRYDIS